MAKLDYLWSDENGGVIAETALLLVLLALACYAAFQALGGTIAFMAGSGPTPIVGE